MKQLYSILVHIRRNTILQKRAFVLLLFVFGFLLSNAQSNRTITDNQTKIVKFYPNPASSNIYFEFDKIDRNTSFQIFNFMGKKVYELQNVSNKNIVDLTDFYRGVYIFQLRDKSGKIIESGKFQVVK